MERRSRSVAKALGWQLIGFVGSTLIMWRYTGRFIDGLALSGWLALSGATLYVFHECLWGKVAWGLYTQTTDTNETKSESSLQTSESTHI